MCVCALEALLARQHSDVCCAARMQLAELIPDPL